MIKGTNTFHLKKMFKKYPQDVSKALKSSCLLFLPINGLVTPQTMPALMSPTITMFSLREVIRVSINFITKKLEIKLQFASV